MVIGLYRFFIALGQPMISARDAYRAFRMHIVACSMVCVVCLSLRQSGLLCQNG